MCLITLIPPNIELPLEGIRLGADSNPDGHGWAVASAEFGLVIGKSMDAEQAIEGLIAERERQGPGSVAMAHSRLGTHGTKNLDNVHPFYVPDGYGTGHDNDTVVAHNGIMPSLWHPSVKDTRSDTRVFADRTATWYITERGVPSRRGGKMLGEMIGKGNKLVFLSTRFGGRPMVRIINVDSGTWEGGVWYSNEWFKRKRPTTHYSRDGKTCAKPGCNSLFYTDNETECYVHRTESSPANGTKTTETKTKAEAKPVTSLAPPEWTGYGVYPPGETDQMLDEIDEALAEAGVVVSDCDPDRVCEVCRTKGSVHLPTNVCLHCRWCLDCWDRIEACDCFDYGAWLAERDAEASELAEALAREAEADAKAEEEATYLASTEPTAKAGR